MTFELSTNGSATPFPSEDEMDVRFLFRNGSATNTSEPVAYPLFGQSDVYLPWKTFAASMGAFAIGSQAQWCSACGNSTGSCSPAVVPGMSPSSGSSSSSVGGMSKATAGVIGAMVTLAVVLGLEGLIMGVGGWRLVSRKRGGGRSAVGEEMVVGGKA